VLVSCTDSIESTAFLRTMHLCSARAPAGRLPPAPRAAPATHHSRDATHQNVTATPRARLCCCTAVHNEMTPPPAPPVRLEHRLERAAEGRGALLRSVHMLESRRLRPERRWARRGARERRGRRAPLGPVRNFARSREARAWREPGAARHSGFLGTGSGEALPAGGSIFANIRIFGVVNRSAVRWSARRPRRMRQ
jgi:hypothetical protein